MKQLDYKELGLTIKDVYLDTGKYQFDKHVPTFEKDGKYVGDFFNFTMLELDGENPPIFYHVYSPYDVISSKSTQQAVVLRSGEIILSSDFTPYMRQRTGVMTSLVLTGLGVRTLGNKNVLMLGTGAIARADLAALSAFFPDLKQISYVTKSGISEDFESIGSELGIEVTRGSLDQIGDYDIIVCHTNAKAPVLTADMKSRIKQGAIITTFSSEDFTEVAPEFFDTNQARIVIDWGQTIDEAPELKASMVSGLAKKSDVLTLKELLSGGLPKDGKQYTIYRSHGTPMQNLAALRVLMHSTTSKD